MVRQAQPRSRLLVVSVGLQCFARVAEVADAGCAPQAVKTGSGPKAPRTPYFKWVKTALDNIKAAITGTNRAINSKHVPRYLAEFEYRFNRGCDLAAMIPGLTWAAVRSTPMLAGQGSIEASSTAGVCFGISPSLQRRRPPRRPPSAGCVPSAPGVRDLCPFRINVLRGQAALPFVSAERYDVSLCGGSFRDHDASRGYRRRRTRSSPSPP